MNKIILLIVTILLFSNELASHPQCEQNKTPLKLTITNEIERICSGTIFVIFSKLENVSKQNVIIDTRFTRRYGTEKAYSQSSSNVFDIPKMRTGSGDTFEDKEVPKEYLVTLKPGEFFEDKFTINPNKDDFFKLTGKYYIKTGYGQYRDWTSKGVNLFIGKIDSNELEFEIFDCKD